MLFGNPFKTTMVTADEALKGSETRRFEVPTTHTVLGTPLEGPWPEGTEGTRDRDDRRDPGGAVAGGDC